MACSTRARHSVSSDKPESTAARWLRAERHANARDRRSAKRASRRAARQVIDVGGRYEKASHSAVGCVSNLGVGMQEKGLDGTSGVASRRSGSNSAPPR